MRRLPALPLSLGVCARLQVLPGALICALSSLLTLPLLATLRLVGGRPGCYPISNPLDTGPLIRHRHLGRCFTFGGAGVGRVPGAGDFGGAQFAQAATGDDCAWLGAARPEEGRCSPAPACSPSLRSAPPSSEGFPERGREGEVGDLGRHFKALRVSSPLSAASHTACALRAGGEGGGGEDEEDQVRAAVLVEEDSYDPFLQLKHLFFDASAEWRRHEVPSSVTFPSVTSPCTDFALLWLSRDLPESHHQRLFWVCAARCV